MWPPRLPEKGLMTGKRGTVLPLWFTPVLRVYVSRVYVCTCVAECVLGGALLGTAGGQ